MGVVDGGQEERDTVCLADVEIQHSTNNHVACLSLN